MKKTETRVPVPIARKEPRRYILRTILPVARVDEYGWLRDRTSKDVLAHLDAENRYADAIMKPAEGRRRALYAEMLARVQQADSTVPFQIGGWLYYQRTEAGKQYPIHCRRRAGAGADTPEVVLLDLNEIARTWKYAGLGAFELSDDGDTLAYGLDTEGSGDFTLHLVDLAGGAALPETIPRATTAAFAQDNRTLLYVAEDEASRRPCRVMRHALGTDPSSDAVVYEEKSKLFEVSIARSRSGAFVFITSRSTTTSEVRYLRADDPGAAPVPVTPRQSKHDYQVDHGGDFFYIRTNDGGPNFRLVKASVADPSRERWAEVVPHRDDVVLDGVEAFAGHLVLRERRDGVVGLRVLDLKSGASAEVEVPEPLHAIAGEPNVDFAATTYRYSYESPVTPPIVFEYDMVGRASRELKRTRVPGYAPDRYEARREHAVTKDGARIPLTLVRRRDTPLSGRSPALLYAYGAYGWPVDDRFSSTLISLLDRGLVYAVAHVRGGGELGQRWHVQGRMLRKKNTFTDLITSAEWLVARGYAAKDRLIAHGLSAGGLTVGAALCMRPDLFRAAVLQAPFVDVTTTMLDPKLPGTIPDYGEWGNPRKKRTYDYITSYSPYDNIAARSYPPLFVTSSLNDGQVLYWGPARFVAKLRAAKTDDHPVIFKVNMEPGGHMGRSGRFDQLEDTAYMYAFILRHAKEDAP